MDIHNMDWIEQYRTTPDPITLININDSKLYGDTYFAFTLTMLGCVDRDKRIIYCTNLQDLDKQMFPNEKPINLSLENKDNRNFLAKIKQFLRNHSNIDR